MITIRETAPETGTVDTLIRLSEDWENENSCRGYRRNRTDDIEGNRIFAAFEGEEMVGYLFGHIESSKNNSSVMPDGTAFFEAEELYVKPAYRNRGIGRALFKRVEEAVRDEAEYILLSTATKNWKAIFRFYIDELGMEFWNARLFKRLRKEGKS